MKKLRMIIITLVALAMPLMAPAAVLAAPSTTGTGTGTNTTTLLDGACVGASLNTVNTTCDNSGTKTANETITGFISAAINILSIVVGAISVVMIIIGGLKYITSGGEAGNVSGAKNTILYAVVGLVIVILAQLIVKFVLSKLSGAVGARH